MMSALAVFAIAGAACNTTQPLGNACGDNAPPLQGEVVEGENSVNELVRIQRDGVCDSFKCLTEGGIAPYCTDPCSYDKSTNASCTSDVDCKTKSEHCIDNVCKADDCPNGFTCRVAQRAGPLAGQLFCLRQTGCLTNFDCGDVGTLRCMQLLCTDQCNLIGGNCDTHDLTCQPRETVPWCLCNGEAAASNATFCDQSALVCTPHGSTALPENAAYIKGVCVGTKQTVNNPLASGT